MSMRGRGSNSTGWKKKKVWETRAVHCNNHCNKFTFISGRQRTTKIQNLVVHKYLWSSSNVFILQNSRKDRKNKDFLNDNLSKIQLSCGRPRDIPRK